MDQAKVYSIEALKAFREQLAGFGEEAVNALVAVDMEARRAIDHITRELPLHWKAELKKRTDKLALAKGELYRRRLAGEGKLDDTVEKEAVRRAEMRLAEAEQKLRTIKKWEAPLRQAAEQYHGQSRGMADLAGPQMEARLAQLARMIDALEAYTGAGPPPES